MRCGAPKLRWNSTALRTPATLKILRLSVTAVTTSNPKQYIKIEFKEIRCLVRNQCVQNRNEWRDPRNMEVSPRFHKIQEASWIAQRLSAIRRSSLGYRKNTCLLYIFKHASWRRFSHVLTEIKDINISCNVAFFLMRFYLNVISSKLCSDSMSKWGQISPTTSSADIKMLNLINIRSILRFGRGNMRTGRQACVLNVLTAKNVQKENLLASYSVSSAKFRLWTILFKTHIVFTFCAHCGSLPTAAAICGAFPVLQLLRHW